MNKTVKNIGKGVMWSLGSVLTAVGAAAVGWIIYSRKYVHHKVKLDKALDADREELESQNEGRLSYYVDRSGKGTPLVLLHSINAAPSAFEMKPIFEHFRGKRPVYALELPGFGFSERSERIYTPILYQNAIITFLSKVVKEPADLVALSLSCEFAGLSAVHQPEQVRSLVMISPTGFNPPRADDLSGYANRLQTKNMVYSGLSVELWNRPFYDLVSSRPSIQFFLNKSFEYLVPDRFVDYAYLTSHQPGAQYAPTYFLSGKLFTPAVRDTVYKLVSQPVLVVYDRDPYTSFDMLPLMIRERDNWRSVRISPTKGLPHWEKPEKTFKAMDSFWSKI